MHKYTKYTKMCIFGNFEKHIQRTAQTPCKRLRTPEHTKIAPNPWVSTARNVAKWTVVAGLPKPKELCGPAKGWRKGYVGEQNVVQVGQWQNIKP